MPPTDLKKIALLLREIYGSFDVALRALITLDEKLGSNLVNDYQKTLMASA